MYSVYAFKKSSVNGITVVELTVYTSMLFSVYDILFHESSVHYALCSNIFLHNCLLYSTFYICLYIVFTCVLLLY